MIEIFQDQYTETEPSQKFDILNLSTLINNSFHILINQFDNTNFPKFCCVIILPFFVFNSQIFTN